MKVLRLLMRLLKSLSSWKMLAKKRTGLCKWKEVLWKLLLLQTSSLLLLQGQRSPLRTLTALMGPLRSRVSSTIPLPHWRRGREGSLSRSLLKNLPRRHPKQKGRALDLAQTQRKSPLGSHS